MTNDFKRDPSGFPFKFDGMKISERADTLPPGKYAVAQNVRAYSDTTVQTRPGTSTLAELGSSHSAYSALDMRAYASLGGDIARTLIFDSNSNVWLDNGSLVGTLAGGANTFGASLIPFRPGASPAPWMYVANGFDYQKFSSPNTFNQVTQAKAGIAEPQTAPNAAIGGNSSIITATPSYVAAGTAGVISAGNRVSDTAGTVLQDPTTDSLWSVQVGTSVGYQKLMSVTIGSTIFIVVDVFAALPANITIQGIYYFSGNTGRCVVVPANISFEGEGSIYGPTALASLRRGALIKIGTETCYVWSVTSGPNNTISIETSTVSNHTTAEVLTTVPAIAVIPEAPIQQQSSIGSPSIASTISLAANPWVNPNNIFTLDGNFATCTIPNPAVLSNSDYIVATNFNFAIPAGAVILGVLATAYVKSTPVNGVFTFGVRLVIGNALTGNTEGIFTPVWTGTVAPALWGGQADTWGLALTPAIVNSAGFGFGLGVQATAIQPTEAFIDWMNLQIFYTVPGAGITPPAPTNSIVAVDSTYQVTTGQGTATSTSISPNPFNLSGVSFQPDDYISIGINIDTLVNLTEVKFLLDVGDASFTQNFFYYTIRPSDIATAIANTSTQLAAAQTVSQRSQIDSETAAINAQAGYFDLTSGAQLSPGTGQWTQIVFPISSLVRVGNDQTKSLQTLTKIQFLWNASGTINVATDLPVVIGGFQPDVGDQGAPYLYRVRPRSRSTGVVGNPSPATRYGVNPRRHFVNVYLPSALYDPQIDTWDIFRYGGTVTEWRFIGSTPSASSQFLDNFDDAAAQAGDALDFDNFEPWPSVDVPNIGTASIVNGTLATVVSTDPDIIGYLPGTLVELGGSNAYTLWARPTLISGNTYLLQFVENAGAGTNIPYIIQEPALARQFLPFMWGPDANGTVFACGDQLRPGSLYFSKNYAPDSAPDTYNQEISQPSEPLLGGETIDGLSYVASPERWWALYPQPQDTAQRYSVVQQPFDRGLAAPFGHCTDGKSLFWVAKDSIQSSSQGNLTGDMYKLFPHEGIAGENHTYGGITIFAPDYTRANTFRLTYSLGYLYFIYQDSTSTYRMLTLDIRRGAWCVDQYPTPATAAYHVEQEPQSDSKVLLLAFSLIVGGLPPAHSILLAKQQALSNDYNSTPISCALATNEFDGGDIRAPKQWGDFFVDCLPSSADVATPGLTVTPVSIGAAVAPATIIPTSPTRVRTPVSVGGVVISDFMGMLATWLDDFTTQIVPTKLYSWQPSYDIQPVRAIAWSTFGTSYGIEGYMHVPWVGIAYVALAPVQLTCVCYDGQSPAQIFLPATGGSLAKALFRLSANKGQLYTFSMSSTLPFQIFSNDCDIYVGAWGRQDNYLTVQRFGGEDVEPSPI